MFNLPMPIALLTATPDQAYRAGMQPDLLVGLEVELLIPLVEQTHSRFFLITQRLQSSILPELLLYLELLTHFLCGFVQQVKQQMQELGVQILARF
jgi:hypothetical protein